MIKEKRTDKIEIDLTGPQGNVFSLIGIGMDLAKQLNKLRGNEYINIKELQADMMSKDYEHAVQVMEKNFGHLIIMYR
jgi:hypothetical protein